MNDTQTAERLVARFIERHVAGGERIPLAELCRDHPGLLEQVRQLVERYTAIDDALSGELTADDGPVPVATDDALPQLDGLQTIERLGRGGMGEVYKVRDLKLGRTVAAKVLRADSPLAERYGDFLREAKSLALFRDPHVVQIHELRTDGASPVILMEHVDGFELTRVAPSLEFHQRASIVAEVCDAVQRAHELGIQHRDLKPANILLDERLSPKIVDFGLSDGNPTRGHLVGTPAYLAPEQLDPGRPIDARSDVYALGVILYELLCGERPFAGTTQQETLDAIRAGTPRLPVEVDPRVPEPLQAIALRAMEREPADRYPAASEMARDLRRFLDGRPVLARPTLYRTALGRRLLPHLEQIDEWLDLRLIYPHEARRLKRGYALLEAREDDWIVQSRMLSPSQIALYLGGFVLMCGALLYFGAHRFHQAVVGVAGPALVLGLPFAALNLSAAWLYRREHRAAAIAFYLAATALLPLFLLIVFHETGAWPGPSAGETQFFEDGSVSNRQLQIAAATTLAWTAWLAARTRTVGLSSVATLLAGLFALSVLTDFGLRRWIERGEWDRLALALLPLLALQAAVAVRLDRIRWAWFSRPLFVGCSLLLVAVCELFALDGRALAFLRLSLARFQAADVSSPALLDTVAAMTAAGLLFYLLGAVLERRGTQAMAPAAWLLIAISPFAMLEPLAYLVNTGEYAPRLDWLYLIVAVIIAWLSHYHQRKSFYLAGLVNTGVALSFITYNRGWADRPAWAVAVVLAGLVALGAGLGLAVRERRRRATPRDG
ncbi:MAG TPA: serine/threonine-protein kinase [Candidatus Polarisedimenticolaceae bacterium]|nr:serine/threonine-protein kinase [Candidatus Polarisedimenticolaceae bacterium]